MGIRPAALRIDEKWMRLNIALRDALVRGDRPKLAALVKGEHDKELLFEALTTLCTTSSMIGDSGRRLFGRMFAIPVCMPAGHMADLGLQSAGQAEGIMRQIANWLREANGTRPDIRIAIGRGMESVDGVSSWSPMSTFERLVAFMEMRKHVSPTDDQPVGGFIPATGLGPPLFLIGVVRDMDREVQFPDLSGEHGRRFSDRMRGTVAMLCDGVNMAELPSSLFRPVSLADAMVEGTVAYLSSQIDEGNLTGWEVSRVGMDIALLQLAFRDMDETVPYALRLHQIGVTGMSRVLSTLARVARLSEGANQGRNTEH
jgi:hypothetical protein